MRELKVDSDSALHEAVTFSSDDLLKHPPAPGFSLQSIPWGGTLAAAKVDFLFTDCDRPHTLFLRPPNTVQVQFPADAARVLAWLKKSAFVLDQKLAGAVGIFLLAMAAALAPSLGDGDGDEDDAASERHFHHVSVC